ncbi:uncharacterized protein LOC134690824 [Mytilus trossulus]|uniref:uncharacterized protein LOC134690824 n=1 Tax=Mytilus trossulus TaxID=6551 RepID=UPI003006A3EF
MKYTVLALVCIVVVNGYSFKRTEKSKYLGDREKFILKHAGIEMAKEEFGEKGAEEADKILGNCLEKPDEEIGECMLDAGKRLCEEGEDDQCKRIEDHIMFTIAVGKNLLESGCLAKEVEDADIGPCLQGKCMAICDNVCDDLEETEEECDCQECCKVEEKDLESAVEELESKEERSTRLNKLRKLNIFRSVLNKRYFGNLIKRK